MKTKMLDTVMIGGYDLQELAPGTGVYETIPTLVEDINGNGQFDTYNGVYDSDLNEIFSDLAALIKISTTSELFDSIPSEFF